MGDLDFDVLSEALNGYSASDIRFLVDEAARKAMRLAGEINPASFETAIERTPRSCGPEIEERYQQIAQPG